MITGFSLLCLHRFFLLIAILLLVLLKVRKVMWYLRDLWKCSHSNRKFLLEFLPPGPLKPEWTGSAATMVIFLMSGLSVNGKEVKRAVMNVHVHVFIQGFTFFIFPLLLFIASHFIQLLDAPEWSSIGWVQPTFASSYHLHQSFSPLKVYYGYWLIFTSASVWKS